MKEGAQEVQAMLTGVARVAVTEEVTQEGHPGYLKRVLDGCYSWWEGPE